MEYGVFKTTLKREALIRKRALINKTTIKGQGERLLEGERKPTSLPVCFAPKAVFLKILRKQSKM